MAQTPPQTNTAARDHAGSSGNAVGQTLLLLGAQGGIGQAVARLATQDGFEVAQVDRALNRGDGLEFELASTDHRSALLSSLPSQIQYVACAVGAPASTSPYLTLQDNFIAPASAILEVLPRVPRGGAVVAVASVSSNFRRIPETEWREALTAGFPWNDLSTLLDTHSLSPRETYKFSKMLLKSWVIQTASNNIQRGIRVNSISPGAVASPRLADYADTASRRAVNRGYSLVGRPASPEEIAGAITYMLYGRGSTWISGQDLVIDGGVSAYISTHNRR